MNDTTKTAPSTWDRAALQVTIVLGIIAAGWSVVTAVLRIIQIAPNKDVPVTAALVDTPASLPLGPGGAAVDVVVRQGTFLVSDMPTITLVSLFVAEVVSALAIVGVVISVCVLCGELIRGRAFGRRSLLAVGWGTFVALGGWVLTWLFQTMGANGGVAAVSDHDSSATPIEIGLVIPFALAALGALAVAFQIGHRLERDNEGLV